MADVRVCVAHPSSLGECPTWDERSATLFWVDIEGKAIHRFDPSTGEDTSKPTVGRPGSFVLTSDPDVLLVAMEHELLWFHWPTGTTQAFVALEAAGNGNRLNDGKTDRAGRYIVGSMFENPNDGRATGSLYSVEADGSFRTVRTDIGVTNGLAFDPVHGRAYFADTHTRTVLTFDYDDANGDFTNERVFLDYDEMPGLPDGSCIDSEGFYWSASVYGSSLIRVSPDGEVVERLELPLEKPSMPAFGGSDLRTMFITTIGMGGSRPSAEGPPGFDPGNLLAAEVAVPGRPEAVFAGTPPQF